MTKWWVFINFGWLLFGYGIGVGGVGSVGGVVGGVVVVVVVGVVGGWQVPSYDIINDWFNTTLQRSNDSQA